MDLDLLEPGPELEDEPVTAESFGAESAGAQLSDAEPTDTELTDAELTDAELAGAEPVDAESVDAAAALGDLPLLPVEPAGTPSVVELESLILDDPDNPDLHLRLADRLVDGGEEVRGLEELELALAGYERRGDGQRASELAERLTILAPDTVRHHQKRVELAFRSGERAPLLAAYLALGDSLARSGATDKALAVFGRVQEHDPGNAHALSALAALRGETQPAGEVEPESRAGLAPPAAPATPSPAAPEASAPQPPGPSVEAPRSQAASPPRRGESDSFVDLGSMILDEGGVRDTRMRVDRADPKGKDEQREFQEILEQFKRGIEQNLDSEDYEAHYDLGVAFKEMGLLDEAIAEFQKALRSPDGRLRTSEALGICFYDKGQYGISETVLRRAVETVDGGDEAKIGLLYWLGRAAEAQGKEMDAITSYERALAVDIRFMDLSDRMHRLAADRQK